MSAPDDYFVKLKACGQSDEQIAKRLGWTVEKVQQKWRELVALSEAMAGNGYGELQSQWLMLAQSYEMVGRNMVGVACGLSNIYQPQELEDLLRDYFTKPGESVQIKPLVEHLLKHCIILKPYIAIDPEKELKAAQDAKQN